MTTAAFALKDVTKNYAGVRALNGVTLEVGYNEVVGLIGENGAGKSTLLKVLSGLESPDRGTVHLRGEQIRFRRVADAMKHGVAMVYQEQSLLLNVTIAENVFLGNEGSSVRAGFYRWRDLYSRTKAQLAAIGSKASPKLRTEALSFAQRQMVEVAKALATGEVSHHQPVILLDEPTSVLQSDEITRLFEVIRELRKRASVVFVSHRIDEVMAICDRVYVMRDGQCVAEVKPGDVGVENLYELMVGRELSGNYYVEDKQVPVTDDRPRLEVRSLSGRSFRDVSLILRPGEVVSLLGVQESGREHLARALVGAEVVTGGSISVEGETVSFRTPADAVNKGFGYIPSERKVDGAVLEMSVRANMTLAHNDQVSRFGVFDNRRESAIVTEWIEKLRIRCPSPETPLRSLSGGNQQKVVLAKWLMDPAMKVLILDTPTRGLDIGARADVYAIIRSLAQSGLSVLLLADTLEEGIAMSHRVITMKDGIVSGEFASAPGNRPERTHVLQKMV